jgi:tRNA A-37 threonylcarbamoyl transferase component Bud32
MRVSTSRWRHALDVLAAVERRSGHGRRLGVGRVGVRGLWAARRRAELDGLSEELARRAHRAAAAPEAVLWARARTPAVRIGKFDTDNVVRLRAFDPEHGVAYRVQERGSPKRAGIHRSIASRRAVASHAPELAPHLLADGTFEGLEVAYLLEELLTGRHPADRGEVQALLPALVVELTRLHRGVGIDRPRLSEVVAADLLDRWTDAVRTEGVSPAVDRVVRSLVERDARVEVSLGHGDLVGSNILLSDGRLVLVDWEHARSLPIAFDLAKPVLQARHLVAAIEAVRPALDGTVGEASDSYRLEEQLVLAYVQRLTWSRERRQKAEAAGRLRRYEQQTARQLTAIAQLLEVDDELGGPGRRSTAVTSVPVR